MRVASWFVSGALLALTACSAAILSVGTHETSLVHRESTRATIHAALGAPGESIRLDPPIPLWSIVDEDRRTKSLVGTVADPRFGSPAPSSTGEPAAVLREVYERKGRIVRDHDVGEAIGLAGYTAGLSEIGMVPASIVIQSRRESAIHKVTAWYDASDRALAYLWREFDADGTPRPNIPEEVFKAPKIGRDFEHPNEIVVRVVRLALLKLGFENKGETPGLVLGWRPYRPGIGGGETLNVWLRPITPQRTRVFVSTIVSPEGGAGQRSWSTTLLDSIAEEL